ncbi:GNAT family N-acetyltransferase [Humibacillus xanthopallidus]|uniref:GNAT family N-acetyltransferase n=1 Tax=Humibacillus xanthopallidus TaxID=412689 RepID=UPI00384B7893
MREFDDPGIDCFVIKDAGRVAGFAATRADELLHFGTAVSTWGTGLADLAHGELLDHLRAREHQNVRLRVFDENTRAIRFDVRRGWLRTDVTTHSTFPPYPTLRRYERRLTWRPELPRTGRPILPLLVRPADGRWCSEARTVGPTIVYEATRPRSARL